MRILVTGAAGFLGGHISRRLLADGHNVTAFDKVKPIVDCRWIEGELRDGESVESAVSGHDLVCHVGAVGDVYLAADQPVLAAEVNVTGSAHVATSAASHGVGVVYASTWEVYGRPVYEPIDEEHPCNPDHPYSITKLAGERMILAAGRSHNVPMVALRLGTAYGRGLRPNSVFRIFIDRARRGEPISVQGDGSQSRQFTHASDIARAFSLACDRIGHEMILNIVSSSSVTIKELAEAVVERYPTELTFVPERPADVPPAFVSAERARQMLGWTARISFSEGLADLLDAG